MNEQSLISLFETVWQHLMLGTKDRTHPARHPTLASFGPYGPELRTLVLRVASRDEACLEFHTDAASPKAAQINANPNVAIHVWIPEARLQIRAKANAVLHIGDANLFTSLPPEAQANYAGLVPGTPLPSNPPEAAPRFGRLLCHLTEIDVLHLGETHIRARYRSDANWAGAWIAP